MPKDTNNIQIDDIIEKANEGSSEAQSALGLLYEIGFVENKSNYKEAKKWWRKAAKNGDPLAQFSLAQILEKGLDGQVDKITAETWYDQAREQGYTKPEDRLARHTILFKPKILVVDDSTTALNTLRNSFEAFGINPILADNGQKGLQALYDNPDIKLILCDIEMPILDGLAMIRKIRKNKHFKDLPIIILSAHSSVIKIKEARKLNVQGWIIKPITNKALKAMITNYIKPQKKG